MADSMDVNAEQRIVRLENQVEGLRRAVRELADALQDALALSDDRVSTVEAKVDEVTRVQGNHARAFRKLDDRFHRSLSLIADALAALGASPTPAFDLPTRDTTV